MTGEAPAWALTPTQFAADIEIASRQRLFIGGRFVTPRSRRHRDVVAPATGMTLTRLTDASGADVDAAITAATAAQRGWTRSARLTPLLRLADRIERDPTLAILATRETGRPIRAATGVDTPLAARITRFNAGWADKLSHLVRGGNAPRAAGVVVVLVSGHAALLRVLWAVTPALAAGCPCVVKPSPHATLACLRLAEIARGADLPPGVLNVVTGGVKTGEALMTHAGARLIVISGRHATCRRACQGAAARTSPVVAEPRTPLTHVVFEDAALDQAVEAIVAGPEASPLASAGLGIRLLVQEPVREEVTARLLDRLRARRVGDPLDANTDIGPLPATHHAVAIDDMLESVRTAGGVIRTGGDPTVPRPDGGGHWCPPHLVTDVPAPDALAHAEAGGPFWFMDTFRTTAEATTLAGDARALAVWSDKSARLFAVTETLAATTVWANTLPQIDPAAAGMAGVRRFLR
ncbi:MAG: aldehyde dehydrogenase family protein [Phycisphaerae bacterium]|nr:aldehyde dehydrogenase family protein [Phycisphaerae bacterium]